MKHFSPPSSLHTTVRRVALLLALLFLLTACGESGNDEGFRGLSQSQAVSGESSLSGILEGTGDSTSSTSDSTSGSTSGGENSDKTSTSTSDLPPTVPTKTVSVLAVGDNLIHRGIYRNAASYAKQTGNGEYDFTPIFEHLKEDIAAADISLINQETMFDPEQEPANYPNFNTPSEVADNLGQLGFDIVSLANNHMLDVGSKGLVNTIKYLDGVEGVTRVGAYTGTDDMNNIRVLERDGLRISVVAFTYGTNGYTASDLVKIPYLNEDNVKSQIATAKQVSDFVMVLVHWGDENSYSISDSQKKYAQLMAKEGADVIIGSHPHVLQPIEWIERGDGSGEKILCAYSLGNLVSMMANEKNMLGGVLQFDIVSENGEKPTVQNVSFEPTVYFYLYAPGSGKDWFDNKIYYLSDFTDELAAKHGIRHYDNTMSLKNLYKIAKTYVAEEYLPSYVVDYDLG